MSAYLHTLRLLRRVERTTRLLRVVWTAAALLRAVRIAASFGKDRKLWDKR